MAFLRLQLDPHPQLLLFPHPQLLLDPHPQPLLHPHDFLLPDPTRTTLFPWEALLFPITVLVPHLLDMLAHLDEPELDFMADLELEPELELEAELEPELEDDCLRIIFKTRPLLTDWVRCSSL